MEWFYIGDNILTALSVAKECEMIEKRDQVVIVSSQTNSLIQTKRSASFNENSSSPSPSQNHEDNSSFLKNLAELSQSANSSSEMLVQQHATSVEVKYTLEDGKQVEIDFSDIVCV